MGRRLSGREQFLPTTPEVRPAPRARPASSDARPSGLGQAGEVRARAPGATTYVRMPVSARQSLVRPQVQSQVGRRFKPPLSCRSRRAPRISRCSRTSPEPARAFWSSEEV